MINAYPRGFVLSRQATAPPPYFIPGPLLENFFVDPACPIDFAYDEEAAVIVLGTCVHTGPEIRTPTWLDHILRRSSPEDMARGRAPSQHLLSALLQGETAFFDVLDQYCGRHAIVFLTKQGTRVLTDATGMRAVFYAAEGGVVASHARLIEETLGEKITRSKLPFGYGFPGNHTPYPRARLLTPNTLYDVDKAAVIRFWPRGPIKSRTAVEAAHIVRGYSATALKNIAQQHRISLSITAGLDSRTSLALALHTGIPFTGYTYSRGVKTAVDCAVARDLSTLLNIQHQVIEADGRNIPEDLRGALNKATYYNHHYEVIDPMRHYFEKGETLTVTANLLEIGRYFYKGGKYDTIADVSTPETMCELYINALSPIAYKAIETYGIDAYKALATHSFADFLRASDFNQARGILASKDQFYWEHRMSAWHAMILLERDFYADCFIPFNSRRVFEAFLGVPEKERKSAKAFKQLIKACAPELLNIPINPREWPLSTPATKNN